VKFIKKYRSLSSEFFLFHHDGLRISLFEKWIVNGWKEGYDFIAEDMQRGEQVLLSSKTINEYIQIIREDYPELLL